MSDAGVPRKDLLRIAKNATWSVAGFAVPTLIMFVGIPIYIGFLGVRGYGLWTLANSALAVAGLVNLSMGEATTKFVAEHQARDEQNEMTRVIAATLTFYTCVGAIGTAVFWSIAPFLAYTVFDLEGAEAKQAVDALQMVAFGFLPTAAMSVATGIFDGLQQFRISQSLIMVRSSLALIVGIIVLFAGGGLVELILSSVIIVWIVCLSGLWLGLRQVPRMRLKELHLVRSLRKVLSFSIYTTITTLGTISIGQVDKLLVGSLISLEAVSYYSVAQSVASKIHIFAISIGRVLMPFFSAKEAESDGQGLGAPLMQSWKATLMISMATVSLAVATSIWLLRVWLPTDVAANALPAYLLFIGAYGLHAINVVPYYYLIGRGRPDKVAWYTLAGGVTMLVLITQLAPTWNVIGAAAASLAFPLVCCMMAVSALKMTDRVPPNLQLRCGVLMALCVHVTAAGTGLLAGTGLYALTQSNLLSVLGAAGACGLTLLAGIAIFRQGNNSYYAIVWTLLHRLKGTAS